MPKARFMTGPARRITTAFLLPAATGLCVSLADPAQVIERSFEQGLAASRPAETASAVPVAGSEAFWLGRGYAEDTDAAAGKVEPVLWTAPVAKGEHIIIGNGAERRILEVVSVERIPPTTTRIDAGAEGERLAVVCRDSEDGQDRLIRFEIAPEKPEPASTAQAL